ncbi:mitochondrial carrier domain-containing protein [Tricharina praecox]|uniref:mitochondrial carrier domain-containing protein n=1 Tax=Tricharina praecox TaxID=43433 RepID=UPI00221F3B62|nr:mitochondrial carrier domain-containing protein [Tricharina praecox]KAI5845511.1 mitochondrial carrier domain-containing protein [Tricharina praecox]
MTAVRAGPAQKPPPELTPSAADHIPISRETGVVEPPHQLRPGESKPWAHFVAGAAGGMTSTFLTSPLDVVKTRLQSDFYKHQLDVRRGTGSSAPVGVMKQGLQHFRETFQILGDVHRIEGWRGLFKGLGPNLSGVVPARAINFYTYGNGKRLIAERFNGGKETPLVHLCAAACAGLVTGTATNPIWLVKTRLQLDKATARGAHGAGRQYKNSFDCVKQVVRQEGVKGLYRGLSASYLGVTESTLQWVLYERMKTYLARRKADILDAGKPMTAWDEFVDTGGKLGAAGTAKLFAACLTYPHEVVRTRMRQRPMNGERPKYTGLLQCFRTIWKEEGIVSMYGGLSPHLLRVVPSAAIMFGMYEAILHLLGEKS